MGLTRGWDDFVVGFRKGNGRNSLLFKSTVPIDKGFKGLNKTLKNTSEILLSKLTILGVYSFQKLSDPHVLAVVFRHDS